MAKQAYKLVFFVPTTHLQAVKEAVFTTGAGRIGNYGNCSFDIEGKGNFLPLEGASPVIGEKGQAETVEETRVEIRCQGEDVTRAAVGKLKSSHPYEEVAYDVYRVEEF